ncbi:MAG: CNNM domain-containing protein [Prevotellaceae bacterium]|jgi:CBS domain containing-hemolysin-like protein|nr:CNNM domain-containing protein [Prevotellaceae bacterium]
MELLIGYLLLALSVSFLCSVAEAVILSIPVTYVKTKMSHGSKTAKKLMEFKDDIDKPLSSILSLNTIAHTVGAAGVGAQATTIFGEAYFGLISAILTVLILVLSEILPKSIGARYCRELSMLMTETIRIMIYVTYPVVLLSKLITKMVSGNKGKETVSREEVGVLAEIGVEEGVFAENESKIINNLLKLQQMKVNTIMTPRTVVISADEETTLSEFISRPEVQRHSRFPIYGENIDNITGYVLKLDVLENLTKGKDIELKKIKRHITVCYEGTTIPKVFDILLGSKEQIALVVDEYGGMDGIITLEDVIETIFGLEIVDERDGQADMQQLAKELWEKRAKELDINIES